MRGSGGGWGAIAAVVGLIMACGGDTGDAGDPGSAEFEPANGDMLVVGIQSDLDTMFPPKSESAVSSDVWGETVYWYLMRSLPDLISFRPGLADSFRFTEDSLSVDFFIHPGVTWHDGHPFTAADVVFAHEVCRAPEINWSAASWLDHITDVQALDSLTVRFTYDERYMYQVIDANVCYPLPEHILGDVPLAEMENHPIARAPVGNGPFRFVSWTPGQEVVLEAYPDFFRGRAHLNRISFQIIPEGTTLGTQIQNGTIDFWPRVTPISFYPQLESDPDLVLHSIAGRSYTYLAWNTQDSLFDDKTMRQALTMAIDREQIVEALLYGQGQVGSQPILSIIWAHDPTIEPYPHDPERAREMLTEAGWVDTDGDGIREKDGRRLAFDLSTNSDNSMRVDIVTIVQSQLREVGADVEAQALEFNTFVDQLLNHDFQAAVGGWSVGIKADLEPLFGSDEAFNIVSASNSELDRLIAAAQTERDMEEAKGLWSEAQRLIVDEAYYTFLFHINDVHAIHERFKNTEMNAYGWSYNLEEWFVPEGMQKYDVPIGASPLADAGASPQGGAGEGEAGAGGR